MRHLNLLLTALLCLLMMPTSVIAKDKVIKVSQLPIEAQTFVARQFPDKKIVRVEKDRDGKTNYEVKLKGGIEIEFDSNGNWDAIDCNHKAVPASLVPQTITEYVKANYPKAIINKIDKESYGYEIELSKGPDLKFNKQGDFISVDRD